MVSGNHRQPPLAEERGEDVLEERHLHVSALVGDVAGEDHVVDPGLDQPLAERQRRCLARRALPEVQVREMRKGPPGHARSSDSLAGGGRWRRGNVSEKPVPSGSPGGPPPASGTSLLPECTRRRFPRHTTVRANNPWIQVRKRSRSFTQTT